MTDQVWTYRQSWKGWIVTWRVTLAGIWIPCFERKS